MICDWCAANSGRVHAVRPCCQLRELALAPRHIQAAHGKTLTKAERDELRPRLLAEKERLKQLLKEQAVVWRSEAMSAARNLSTKAGKQRGKR